MNLYTKKRELMSENELKFFKILKELKNELDIIIHPQINLATIIKKIIIINTKTNYLEI